MSIIFFWIIHVVVNKTIVSNHNLKIREKHSLKKIIDEGTKLFWFNFVKGIKYDHFCRWLILVPTHFIKIKISFIN